MPQILLEQRWDDQTGGTAEYVIQDRALSGVVAAVEQRVCSLCVLRVLPFQIWQIGARMSPVPLDNRSEATLRNPRCCGSPKKKVL